MIYNYVFACAVVVSLHGHGRCNSANSRKGQICSNVQQLERQMQLLAGSQHIETLSRQQDSATLLDRLNSVEMLLNDTRCCKAEQFGNKPVIMPDAFLPKDEFIRMKKAFKDEKVVTDRLQKQVPEVIVQVNNFDKTLGDILHSVESIKENTGNCTMFEASAFFNVVNSLKNDVENISIAVQNTRSEIAGLNARLESIEDTLNKQVNVKNSCMSHYKAGRTTDGTYEVYPTTSDKAVMVYCDMTTDGGGWTVIQRRNDGSEDFFRNWTDYKQGFGDLRGEFWLGNDNIVALTSTCCHELRIDLEDFDGNTRYAKYGKFQVLPETDNYTLIVDEYSGDAGDSLKNQNKMQFTTFDRDNDLHGGYNCVDRWKGAWWHKACHHSNLNGLYFKDGEAVYAEGMNWNHWRGYDYSLKRAEMKLR